ncbi:SulP family inorganic anion transporter [Ascidiimonas aurantiaca]|uniref:SulP family inorganic anion transporter n=1 Tax=Ascidiimonas aurantiaca TaxID=1685432 RepID=UPI0030EF0D08
MKVRFHTVKKWFHNLRGDTFGGLTAGIVALPLALAFGVQSGLGASAGLYGALFIGVFASVFGGTATQISGPTAPMTVVSAVLISTVLASKNGDIQKALPIILGVFLMAGLLQIILGILKIGQYIKYVPYPVISGFMTGIGVIILITQIFPLFGYRPSTDAELINRFKPQAEEVLLDKILKDEAGEGILVLEDFRETIVRAEKITPAEITREAQVLVSRDTGGVMGSLKYAGRAIKNIQWVEFWLTLATISIVFVFRILRLKIPGTLAALIIVTLVAYLAQLDVLTVSDRGKIPEGFPILNYEIFAGFSFAELLPYLATAFALAGLGAIDSLLTSVVADNITKTRHNSNRELIGQGIGNSVAALFGGIPGAGATIRTVVNIHAGGKTRLSGIIHGLVLLLILLVLGPVASDIPLSVLGGILITVGIGVMDYKGLRTLRKMPRGDALVLIVVLLLTVFLDLMVAVGIGLVIATLMFMKKMGNLTASQSRIVSLEKAANDTSLPLYNTLPKNLREEVFIKHFEGPLFFGYTKDFQQLMATLPQTATHVIFDMENVPYIDQSGLFAFEDVLMELTRKQVTGIIVGIKEQPLYRLKSIDIVPDLVPENLIFSSLEECMAYVREHVEDVY